MTSDREEKSIHHHRGNPPFFLFQGLRLYGVYPFFWTYGVYPFLLFSQEKGIHHRFFALWPRGRATDRKRRGATVVVYTLFSPVRERIWREAAPPSAAMASWFSMFAADRLTNASMGQRCMILSAHEGKMHSLVTIHCLAEFEHASQNRSDPGGHEQARNHSITEIVRLNRLSLRRPPKKIAIAQFWG